MSKLTKPKKTLYMLLIFTVICAGITTACIYNTLQIRKNKEFGYASSSLKIEPISLTQKYKTNAIKVKNFEERTGNIIMEFGDGISPIYEYEVFYDQISGLKNATIENKINEEIKRTAMSFKSSLTLLFGFTAPKSVIWLFLSTTTAKAILFILCATIKS